MKINKKLAVTLALIFLFNTSGLFAHIHYCEDSIKHFSFYCNIDDKEKDICNCISLSYETENLSFSKSSTFSSETRIVVNNEFSCCVDNFILILNKIESNINWKTKNQFEDCNFIANSISILFLNFNEQKTINSFVLPSKVKSSAPTFLTIRVLLI